MSATPSAPEADRPESFRAAPLVAGFVLLHVLVWWLVPLVSSPNVPLDVAELHWWGQEWRIGYYKHPPLPAWMIASLVDLRVGMAGIYLVSQICIAICFGSLWALARRWLDVRTAVAAVALLETVYFYNYSTPELNNNVVLMACWAASVTACWLAVETDRLAAWLLLGLAMGLGLLTKYSQGIIGLVLLGWLLLDPVARRCWRRPGPWLACGLALGLFAPHLNWAAAHDWITLQYVGQRSADAVTFRDRLLHPLDFMVDQLLPLLPMMLIVRRLRRKGAGEVALPAAPRRFLGAVVLAPFLLHLLLSAVTGAKLRSMWGAPLWTFAPLAVVAVGRPRIDRVALRRLMAVCGTASVILALALGGRNLLGPYLTGVGERVHFDGQALAAAAADAWATVSDEALPVVAGPSWLAGNVCFYLPHHPSVYASLDPQISEWVSDDEVRRRGAVLIWYADLSEQRYADEQSPEELAAWLARFPNVIVQPEMLMEYRTGADLPPLRIGLAVVPPAK